jgi:hypothetical protein
VSIFLFFFIKEKSQNIFIPLFDFADLNYPALPETVYFNLLIQGNYHRKSEGSTLADAGNLN